MSAQPLAKKGKKADPHCLLLDPATIPAGKKGLAVRLDFTKASCRHVAERFGFLSVDRLQAQLQVKQIARDCWQVSGRLSAQLVQACIATGQPVSEQIETLITERFVPPNEESDATRPEEVVADDSAEYLEAGMIPLGEMLVQHAALAANPWPRHAEAPQSWQAGPQSKREATSPDAGLDTEPDAAQNGQQAGRENPFAVLSRLKNK